MILSERRLIRHVEPAPRWLLVLCLTIFIVYALNFLYFFVDDEGIPYVYAQNLLHGHGLSYNTLEGPVEGYSDFLHVWLATLILAVVRASELPKLSVFFVGKAISFGCALGILGLVWAVIQRLQLAVRGAIVGMAVICLSGPVAVWSCSSLETLPFAFGAMCLIYALVTNRDVGTLASAVFLVLERIDGFVYAGLLIAAFFVCSDASRRSVMLRRIIAPLIVVAIGYHGWRWWYFQDPVPASVEAKVLHKLTHQTGIVVKPPDAPYVVRFAEMYGWVLSTGLILGVVGGIRAGGPVRALAVGTIALATYVNAVGDWMFGFRFFVPVVGLLAILAASATDRLWARSPRLALLVAVMAPSLAVLAAAQFLAAYCESESTESFLRHPSRDPRRFFDGYYALYETARHMMFPGQVIAYNQAGFIPYMLDVVNIDDLGICSRFYANLPTTDVFFTEVGRYTPLTPDPPLGAGEAYLLYHNAQFLIVRRDLLLKANGRRVPPDLLDCYYELVATDSMGQNSIYVRTRRDAEAYRTDPRTFVENLAHVSHLRHASLDGRSVAPHEYTERFPFLMTGAGDVTFTGQLALALVFSGTDENVTKITVDDVLCDQQVTADISFFTRNDVRVRRLQLPLSTRPSRLVDQQVDISASRVTIDWAGPPDVLTTCRISDLRVVGQSRVLADYVTRMLSFPAPR